MKNKGFTLIELLAVILILGIIALIAIPTVNNILKESRQGAFNASMQNIIKAAEEKCLTEHMKGNTVRQFIFTNGKVSPALDVKGDLPKSGIINLNENCEATATLSDGDRKYELTYEGSTVEECTSNSCSFASNLKESDEKYQCFNFDEETGTILKYDGSNPICQGDIYIPAMINNIPVLKIHDLAFIKPEKIVCKKNGIRTEHDGLYIPGYDEDCDAEGFQNPYTYNSLNMSDAGFLTEVGYEAFVYTALKEIKFNDNLKKIDDFGFELVDTKKLVLPKNLEYLGEWAFEWSNIEELVINDKLKKIGDYAFKSNFIKNINIPEGVEYIGEGAFAWVQEDYNDVIVNLPDSLIGIGDYAFEGAGIKTLNFGKNLQHIGGYAFEDNYIETLNIPLTVTEIGTAAFSNNKLIENVFIYNRNSDGSENKKSLNSYAGESKEVVIPNQVEEIGDYTFYISNITNIELNEGLKYIGNNAFTGIKLTSITIPSTVEIIQKEAFSKKYNFNSTLTSIINKTGRAFDWSSITCSSTANQIFETGTIFHENGEVIVSK